MARTSQSRGVFFGPGNRGFATIFGRQVRGDFADFATKSVLLKAQLDKERREAEDDLIKDVKINDSFSIYKPQIDKLSMRLIDDIKNDPTLDRAEVKKRAIKLGQLYSGGVFIGDGVRNAAETLDKDKRVINGKGYLENKYGLTGSLKELEVNMKSDPKAGAYEFLNDLGGSQYINASEAFKSVIDKIGEEEILVTGDPTKSSIGLGAGTLTQEHKKVKIKNLFEYNEETGAFRVKDPEALESQGLLDVFMSDPFTKRVIDDTAHSLHKAQGLTGPVDNDLKSRVLGQLLRGFEGGRVDQKKVIQTFRTYVDTSGFGQSKKNKAAFEWLDDVRRGDARAWDFLVGVTIDGFRITGTRQNEVGETFLIGEGKDRFDRPTKREFFTNNLLGTGEALLGYYNEAARKRETEYKSIKDPLRYDFEAGNAPFD